MISFDFGKTTEKMTFLQSNHDILEYEHKILMVGDLVKKLSASAFQKSVQTIKQYGRDLERELIRLYFFGGHSSGVIKALEAYQNEGGGFGGAIELDFTLPLSSPMATSVGLRMISYHCKDNLPVDMIKKAVAYLKSTFNEKGRRWYAVPRTVNDYPHAPWWHFRDEINMTYIDYSWGNPTAEIVGYLLEYRDLVDGLDVDALNLLALEKLEAKMEFQSEHEIYCYIPLYERQTDIKLKKRYEAKIKEAVEQLLCTDPDRWFSEYLPKPLDFIKTKDSNYFGISEQLLNQNLDMVIESLEEKGEITPTWEWGQYEGFWKEAKKKWTADLTAKALLQLKSFERI